MISKNHKLLAVSANCRILKCWLAREARVEDYESCLLAFTYFFRGSPYSFDNVIFQEWLEISLMNLVELCMSRSPHTQEYLETIITSLDRATLTSNRVLNSGPGIDIE